MNRRLVPSPRLKSFFRPGLELFEDRVVPAVTAVNAGGTLTITMDATTGANAVVITEFNVAGGGAVNVVGTGFAATNFVGVTNIVVNNTNVAGSIDLVTYNGNGVAGDAANTRINGTLTVNNNTGANLNIQLGATAGIDDITIAGGVVVNNTVTNAPINLVVGAFGGLRSNIGNLTVTSNGPFVASTAGVAALSGIADTTITGNVSITNNHTVGFGAGGSVFNVALTTISGFFSYAGGAGSDALAMGGPGAAVTIGGNLAIATNGTNSPGAATPEVVLVFSTTVAGSATFLGGVGNQNFFLGIAAGLGNAVGGNMTVNMVSGGTALAPDVFAYDGSIGGSLSHQGNGSETFVIGFVNNTTVGGFISYNNAGDAIGSIVSIGGITLPTFGAGNGSNVTGGGLVGATTVTLGTFLSILTGAGNDTIGIGRVTAGQNLGLVTGAGNDQVVMHDSIIAGQIVAGSNLGSGSDFLSFDGQGYLIPGVGGAQTASASGVQTIIGGAINILLGSEQDQVNFGSGAAGDGTTFSTANAAIGTPPLVTTIVTNLAQLTAINAVIGD